jgi:O-antigen/teichoic acid export membrane protein
LDVKHIWESKTFWVNLITVVIAIFADPAVQAVFGPNWQHWGVPLLAAGNIILRAMTDKPVAL